MAGTTISTFVYVSETIGVDGIKPKLTITKTGEIAPSSYGAAGLVLPAGAPTAQILNKGVIIGGPGYYGSPYGIAAGAAVVLDASANFNNIGKLYGYVGGDGGIGAAAGGVGIYVAPSAKSVQINNSGEISAGFGGYSQQIAGAGAAGVDIHTRHTAKLDNTGTITAGGGGDSGYGVGGNGGIGVYVQGDNSGGVKNSGTIEGGGGGYSRYSGSGAGAGGAGLLSTNGAIVSNSGLITGGAGGSYHVSNPISKISTAYGGQGGDGVYIGRYQPGSLTNSGTIIGGAGGYGTSQVNDTGPGGTVVYFYGRGGAGLYLYGSAINSGFIAGGAGGNSRYLNGIGGAGVSAYGPYTYLANRGTIIGGEGGTTGNADFGGTGGDGADLLGGAEISNTGTILGGGAAGSYEQNGKGGNGVVINGGTLINAGTVVGSRSGSEYYGSYGSAVSFSGAGELQVDPGAVFVGAVAGNAAFSDVLELAGTSTTALFGIGTQFTNFNTIAFAAGAARTISGNQAGLTSGETFTGFTSADGIDLNFLTFNAADRLTVATAGTLSLITPTNGTFNLDIQGATVGETDFTRKASADGILIGKKITPAAMSFIAPLEQSAASSAASWLHPEPAQAASRQPLAAPSSIALRGALTRDLWRAAPEAGMVGITLQSSSFP